MSDMMIEAWNAVTEGEATAAQPHYVSLYEDLPFYGGAEEGGWWGNDRILREYLQVPSLAAAEALRYQLEITASEMTKEAKRSHAAACLAQCEQAWERGVDPETIYGEDDGASEFIVRIETVPGAAAYRGCRHYE